jgi:hypothetical protein
MNRMKVDSAAPAVKRFLHSLPIGAAGIEIELGGQVLCKIVRPGQLSDAEKACALGDVRKLLERSRARGKKVPAKAMERDIREALATVRGR